MAGSRRILDVHVCANGRVAVMMRWRSFAMRWEIRSHVARVHSRTRRDGTVR